MADIDDRILARELKKGSAELIVLSIVEARPRHGYEISKLIELRSGGEIKFHVASLYPLLYRLEERGWLKGRWVEKAGQRRRRVRLAQRPHEFGEGLVALQLGAHERERFGLVDALAAKLGVAQLEVLGKLVDDFSLARRAQAQAREA